MQIKDIVILADQPNSKELELGRVVEVYPDSKGLVCSAKLRTKNGEIIRPIVKMNYCLCRLKRLIEERFLRGYFR